MPKAIFVILTLLMAIPANAGCPSFEVNYICNNGDDFTISQISEHGLHSYTLDYADGARVSITADAGKYRRDGTVNALCRNNRLTAVNTEYSGIVIYTLSKKNDMLKISKHPLGDPNGAKVLRCTPTNN